jgi:hypothetical protein
MFCFLITLRKLARKGILENRHFVTLKKDHWGKIHFYEKSHHLLMKDVDLIKFR